MKATSVGILFGLIFVLITIHLQHASAKRMNRLESKRFAYVRRQRKRAISERMMKEYIQIRMLALSKREGSSTRLAVERCARGIGRGCFRLSRRCHSSILVKRSIDSKQYVSEDATFWYDPVSDELTEVNDIEHHVVKRAAKQRRRGKRIRITCQLCREKCWK